MWGYSGVLQSHLSSCNRRAASWCDTSLRFQSRSWYTVRRLFDGTANKFLTKSRDYRREAGRGGGSWSHKTPIAVAHHTTSMCAELCKQADSKHTQHHQFQACSSGQALPLLPLPTASPLSPLFCLIGNYHSRASELCPMANVLPIIRRAWWLLHSSPQSTVPQSKFQCKFHSPRRSWNISSENRPDSNLAHAVSIDDAVVVVVDADLDVLFGCKIFAARPFNKLTRR